MVFHEQLAIQLPLPFTFLTLPLLGNECHCYWLYKNAQSTHTANTVVPYNSAYRWVIKKRVFLDLRLLYAFNVGNNNIHVGLDVLQIAYFIQ